VILAASFAVLILSPSVAQIGFAVAIGILLSAVVTARVLVPSLTVIAGRRAWWPGRVARESDALASEPDALPRKPPPPPSESDAPPPAGLPSKRPAIEPGPLPDEAIAA
jgi:putative drug exporter of the RND superfamily